MRDLYAYKVNSQEDGVSVTSYIDLENGLDTCNKIRELVRDSLKKVYPNMVEVTIMIKED